MKFRSFSIPILLSAVLVACTKEVSPRENLGDGFEQQSTVAPVINSEEEYVLGNYISIPYSLDNLQNAYSSLDTKTKSSINIEAIQPTHYYIRFYPKNSEELDILRNLKPRVFLSEIPLDREVLVHGSYYHDPSIPSDRPTFQYTTLPVERWQEIEDLPVESEILIEAYIPDYDDNVDTKATSTVGNYDTLLRKAYEMCGLPYEEVIAVKSSSWVPTGRVTAYDTRTGSYIPVRGVRIRGTHLLKVKETLTDYNGQFELPSFKNPVNMKSKHSVNPV